MLSRGQTLFRYCQLVRHCSGSGATAGVRAAEKVTEEVQTARVEKTVNNVTLLGRVGAPPQKRGTTQHPVVIFSLATHANYNYQSGELLQKTDWHRICVFKPYLRESVYKHMQKGQRIYVEGRISYGEVQDEDGKAHITSSIIADDVIFISDPKKT